MRSRWPWSGTNNIQPVRPQVREIPSKRFYRIHEQGTDVRSQRLWPRSNQFTLESRGMFPSCGWAFILNLLRFYLKPFQKIVSNHVNHLNEQNSGLVFFFATFSCLSWLIHLLPTENLSHHFAGFVSAGSSLANELIKKQKLLFWPMTVSTKRAHTC